MEDRVRITARSFLRACVLVALASAIETAPSAFGQTTGKGTSVSGRPNYFLSESGAVVYVPTKATIIEPKTKKARKPTAAEVDELMATLKPLQQPTASVAGTKRPNGSTSVMLDGRVEYVVVARAAADGTYETRCIGSVTEAVEFLGLKPVPADSPEATKFLGDNRN